MTARSAILSGTHAAKLSGTHSKNIEVLLPRVDGRIILTDEERASLAVLGKAMSRKSLEENSLIFTPETILRWHKRLVAAKWTFKANSNPSRVGLMKTIKALAVKFALENPQWGYDRIQGALKNIGHIVCPNTIKSALKHAGIDPHVVQNLGRAVDFVLKT